jgi:hypothetical protein
MRYLEVKKKLDTALAATGEFMVLQCIKAHTDTMRTLGFAAIGAGYAAVGAPLSHAVRMLRIINATDGDMIFSDDSTDAAGKWFVPAGSFVLYDYSSNSQGQEGNLAYGEGVQIYVKQSTAASKKNVYIECTYAQGQ